MNFTFFSWISRFFPELHVFFHEFHIFFMNFRFFLMNFTLLQWISRFFHEFHVFFYEFHVFFMNFTFFSWVSRFFSWVSSVSHVSVHARWFESRTKENIGNLALAHIFGRCIPILQPKLVIKEVFKYIFAKMYTNTANPKDCGMDPPPHPPLGTWMERLQHLKCFPTSDEIWLRCACRNETWG